MGTCGASCGITKQRAKERDKATAAALRAFAEGRRDTPRWWPDKATFTAAEVEALAEALRRALPCRVAVVPAADELSATWLYVVATVGAGSWVELREGTSARVPRVAEERGLRVGLSALYRAAVVQEFGVRATVEGATGWVEETRVAGVEDRRLQMFVKASQGLLRTMKISTLDAAFLGEPSVEGGDPLWSLLFDADPMASRVGVEVALGRSAG